MGLVNQPQPRVALSPSLFLTSRFMLVRIRHRQAGIVNWSIGTLRSIENTPCCPVHKSKLTTAVHQLRYAESNLSVNIHDLLREESNPGEG